MSAAALVADLKARGVELGVNGGRLRWRAPEGVMTAAMVETQRAHKPEVMAALNARITRRWGDATEAVAWFMSSEPPSEPFVLWPGDPPHRAFVTVVHPERFWRALKGDVAAGPGRARDMYGAVRRDVVQLYALFGNPL